MAEIRAFHGIHYNPELIPDFSTVICPPYDIIPPQMQEELYHRSEYNFIRIEYNRELPQDTPQDNRYTRSAATLERWLKQGILQMDKTPALYIHHQYFTYEGKEYRRRGLVACIRLEEWDKRVVRPHEGTLAAPKRDRLSLLWALKANTSPIMSMFEDKGQHISSLLNVQETKKPLITTATNNSGERHTVWAITEPEVISQIGSSLAEQPIYIADGHHRYESALTYCREQRTSSESASKDALYNFVLMTLIDLEDPGLLILPPHRLVRGVSKSTMSELMAKLESFFDMEKLPINTPNSWQRVDSLLPANSEQVSLGLFGLVGDNLLILKLRDWKAASQMMPYFHTDIYKKLDVSFVDHIILEKLIGTGSGGEGVVLDFSYDRRRAISRVRDQEYQLAFIIKPVRPEVVKAIADANDRMPRKSTYFYPKLPSGLVFYQFGD